MSVYAKDNSINLNQDKVIDIVKKAEDSIKEKGKECAIAKFIKNSNNIFAIDFNGTFLASPIYPELIGTNQFNFKDPSGSFVVQEEIIKAKAGGGWMKGRWRINPQTGRYECRKIYIHPMPGDYLIGSWYYYPPVKEGNCLI